LHPVKNLKLQLKKDAHKSADESIRREARKYMGLKQNEEVLKIAAGKGQEIDSIIKHPNWPVVESILFKAMGLDSFTKAMRGNDREAKETSAEQYSIVQGILDSIYVLSERGIVAQKMLDELRAKE
jgi:hypothetical protein